MQYRTPGKTGWRVSAVSMGCGNIGGQWGEVSEETARATLHRALDCGVNLFDPADAYGAIPRGEQCHLGGASEAETEVFLEGFSRLKEAGLIRAWGASTC